MENHDFWDENIEAAVNQAFVGNCDIYELQLVRPADNIYLYKTDVIALAKCFGLAVYEADSAL
jgi:hypothetical protein